MDGENTTESVINANTHSVICFSDNQEMPRSDITSPFWDRLMAARAKVPGLGTTQTAIVKELKGLVTYQSAVTNWKTGKKLPQLETVIEMARIAKCSVDWLLTGEIHDYSEPDEHLKELLTFWSKLTEESKHYVVSAARFQRSTQITASAERIKDVHQQLQTANHLARSTRRPVRP